VKSLSKILEKIVQISLVNHLELNNLLYKHQYGFLRAKSTEHNLIHVLNNIANSLNDGNFAIGVFLDLRKAFDVCDHSILLSKLSRYGISGSVLEWFTSYLTNRKQVVDLSGFLSKPQPLDISTIQGSLLGPILFLVYINDFPACTRLDTFLFADDTTALKTGHCLHEIVNSINTELKSIVEWFCANKMALNISKTKYVVLHNKGKNVDMNGMNIVIDENRDTSNPDPAKIHTLERVHNLNPNPSNTSFKLLGIHLDENLTLQTHVSLLCTKLSRALYILRQTKNFLPATAIRMLYFSLFHCHLTYCPIVLSITSKSNIAKILKLQKKAIRIVCNAKNNAHTNTLFYEQGILPFDKIIILSKLMFMHAIAYNYNIESFNNIWHTNQHRNLDMELRNVNEFILPLARRELFKKFPIYSLPWEWNQLGDTKLQRNRTTFKIQLTYDLFQSLLVTN
jgi:hypothetical protein